MCGYAGGFSMKVLVTSGVRDYDLNGKAFG